MAEGAKGTMTGMTSVRKVIRAQMKGSPEDHNMMMSTMCVRISKTECLVLIYTNISNMIVNKAHRLTEVTRP